LRDRSKLYQEGENPGSHGAQSCLPDGSGGKLKRVMMALKLRTKLDMVFSDFGEGGMAILDQLSIRSSNIPRY
jgi:hypothetical protein